MTRLRWTFVGLMAFVIALTLGQPGQSAFLQTQRDQIAVVVLVNVTPAVAYEPGNVPVPAQRGSIAIASHIRRARGSDALTDAPDFKIGNAVAQAQSAVRVQASVSPNPNATLLYSNVPDVTINQTAGTTATTPVCVYTVTVDTPPTTSWTLDDGLSGDFIANTWPGKDLSNNTYLQAGTPQPTATPFIVYAGNNSSWNPKEKSSGMQTYCVTLTLTIPSTVPGGAYSTNAIYTLYF
ncbi:MAG TPA: hypothetical protein VIO32_11095 [Candidatus Baltobacteraceae bacterium]